MLITALCVAGWANKELFLHQQAIIIWRAGSAGYRGNLSVEKCLLPHFCWFSMSHLFNLGESLVGLL